MSLDLGGRVEFTPEPPPDLKSWDESKLYLARELHRMALLMAMLAVDVQLIKEGRIAERARRHVWLAIWSAVTTGALYLGKAVLEFLASHIK